MRKSIKHKKETTNIQMSFGGHASSTEKLKKLKIGNMTGLKTQTNLVLTESREQTDSLIKINWC